MLFYLCRCFFDSILDYVVYDGNLLIYLELTLGQKMRRGQAWGKVHVKVLK